jgi:pyruvate formate lyase activating enzyme
VPVDGDPTGLIFNIMRFSLHDGPGIRTTVFLKGCPLACWWCHNPESQDPGPELVYSAERCRLCADCAAACPEHAIQLLDGALRRSPDLCRACGACVDACLTEARDLVGRRVTASSVIRDIERDVIFFDESGGGVTFSGGEPVSQPAFLDAMLTGCRARRIHTVIDTCGFAQRDVFLEVASKADLVLYDLKTTNRDKHDTYTGVSNELVLDNLEALASAGRPVIVRLPVIPGINDSREELAEAAALLARLPVRHIELLPYHRGGVEKYRRLGVSYRLNELVPPSPARMAEIADEFRRAGVRVKERVTQ